MRSETPPPEEFFAELERRPNRSASTSLFLAIIALVSSYALIGGVIALPALYLAKRGLRQILLMPDRNPRVNRVNRTMAVAAVPLAVLAVLLTPVFAYYWFAYLPGHHKSPALSGQNPPSTQKIP